eukprot:scaffold74151_cov54-Attheya_sp.AAC.1
MDGLSYAKRGKILSEFKSEGRRIDEFLLGVERIVNTSMLGTVESPLQCKVPTNMPSAKLDTQIGIICMINDKSVTMVDCLGELIQYCIPPMEIDRNGNDRLEVWMRCLPYYRSAMKKLRQHQDFTDSDIESFQNHQGQHQCRSITEQLHNIDSVVNIFYMYKLFNELHYKLDVLGHEDDRLAMNNRGGGGRGGPRMYYVLRLTP